MFRTFARLLGANAQDLFLFHPSDLTALLELAWDRRFELTSVNLGLASPLSVATGHPIRRSDLNRFEDSWIGRRVPVAPAPAPPPERPAQRNLNPLLDAIVRRTPYSILWDHLIYANMIENSRIYDIFRRVVH